MKFKPLPMEVKRFATKCAACHDSPTEIVQKIRDEFGLVITRSTAARYDPTRIAGASLCAELRELFEATRKEFLETLEAVPLAHRTVRLRKLQSVYDEARTRGDLKSAVSALTAAQRETSDIEYVEGDDV